MLEGLPEKVENDPAIARARSALALAESAPAADTSAREARIAADPDDHEARYELAGALAASGNRDAAADHLLESIGRDREWNEGAARKRLLQLLEAVGLEDPWAGAQRRRLSAILFG
jgi:putative thioredoxin